MDIKVNSKVDIFFVFNKKSKKWDACFTLTKPTDFYIRGIHNKKKLEKKEWKLLIEEDRTCTLNSKP